MKIKNLVQHLVLKYKTKDPYELASKLGIIVIEENLGTVNGYYNEVLEVKFIHVNENLSKFRKNFTIAHELGHAILHPNLNHYFLKTHTLFNIEKFEKEANLFALHLVFDENIKDLQAVKEIISFYDGLEEKIQEYLYKWGVEHGFSECS